MLTLAKKSKIIVIQNRLSSKSVYNIARILKYLLINFVAAKERNKTDVCRTIERMDQSVGASAANPAVPHLLESLGLEGRQLTSSLVC